MLKPLTLLLVLRIISAASLYSSTQLKPYPPRTSTTTTTTTSRPFLAGVEFINYLNQRDNFDDYVDYKEHEIKKENYVDYEEFITPIDVNVEPLQPDNDDEYYDYDESTENTVNSLNQNYNNLSDWEAAIFNNSDYKSSWDQFDLDWVYNRTNWDQYNQSDWEYNQTAWADLTPGNLSSWEAETNDTESKPIHQFESAQYSSRGQVQIKQGQGYYLQSAQEQTVTKGQRQNSQRGIVHSHTVQSNTGQLFPTGLLKRRPPPSRQGSTRQEPSIPNGSQFNGTKVKEKMRATKCCPLGQGYDIVKKGCVKVSDSFNPPVLNGLHLFYVVNANQNFKLKFDIPKCHQNEKLIQATNISDAFYVRWNGYLTVEFSADFSPARSYNPDKYCMDNFVISDNFTDFDALICDTKSLLLESYTHTTLTCVCMLVTCFLILLRVILFAWLPELRTLHGMILMAYLISFLVGFMLLAVMELLFELDVIVQDVCTFFSFIIYFSMLSAFFWRNIMCYDIWWTFSGKRAFSSRGFSSHNRFNLYSAYAFGVPLALTVLLGALEFSTLPNLHPLMPKLRIQGCFLSGNSKLLYLYGPIILLFIINVIFSTLTAVKIAAIKKETKNVLQSNESSTHDQQNATQRFSLYLKLFTAMAFLEVNWMLEVVAVFAPDITSLLHILDIYNVLAPLVIFINFMCQKQTWKMIKKRYRQVRGLPNSGVPTSGTQATQSQDDIESQIKQV